MIRLHIALLTVPPLLLAGCSGDSADDDQRSSSGEVLEGTISDAMLPVDTVRSEPPLAEPVQPRAGTAAAEEGEESEEAGAAGGEAVSGDTDAAEPQEEEAPAEAVAEAEEG